MVEQREATLSNSGNTPETGIIIDHFHNHSTTHIWLLQTSGIQ